MIREQGPAVDPARVLAWLKEALTARQDARLILVEGGKSTMATSAEVPESARGKGGATESAEKIDGGGGRRTATAHILGFFEYGALHAVRLPPDEGSSLALLNSGERGASSSSSSSPSQELVCKLGRRLLAKLKVKASGLARAEAALERERQVALKSLATRDALIARLEEENVFLRQAREGEGFRVFRV